MADQLSGDVAVTTSSSFVAGPPYSSAHYWNGECRAFFLGDRRIRRIGGVVGEALVVVVDLEKDPMAVGVERAKVMQVVPRSDEAQTSEKIDQRSPLPT
jgi:hypothetical protein